MIEGDRGFMDFMDGECGLGMWMRIGGYFGEKKKERERRRSLFGEGGGGA
jgi:hypothetical protein